MPGHRDHDRGGTYRGHGQGAGLRAAQAGLSAIPSPATLPHAASAGRPPLLFRDLSFLLCHPFCNLLPAPIPGDHSNHTGDLTKALDSTRTPAPTASDPDYTDRPFPLGPPSMVLSLSPTLPPPALTPLHPPGETPEKSL